MWVSDVIKFRLKKFEDDPVLEARSVEDIPVAYAKAVLRKGQQSHPEAYERFTKPRYGYWLREFTKMAEGMEFVIIP